MYEKYSTDALVCGSTARNTSDKSYLLFTREAGMVRAVASSVRLEKSKQRQSLQDFSQIRVSLVSGKAGWRVTGVEPIANAFLATDRREVRSVLHTLVGFVRRYMVGEVALTRTYDDITACLALLPDSNTEEIDMLLLLFELRALHQLGYVEENAAFAPLLTPRTFTEALEVYDTALNNRIDAVVRRAATESQL